MNVFLTGATGFVGSYVLNALLMSGHNVRALKRSDSSSPRIPLISQPEWLIGNLTAVSAKDFKGIDVIVHLASKGVSPQIASFDELIDVNLFQSAQLLELAALSGVRRIVAVGTSHEYGTTSNLYDFIPPTASLAPVNEYGSIKASAFYCFNCIPLKHHIEYFYGRIFSAYGLGQNAKNFWPSLRQAALSGSDFKMTSGDQITDFIPIESVADYLVSACSRNDIDFSKPLIVNIGSGKPMSLLRFAETQWSHFNPTGKILPGTIQARPVQLKRCVPDLTGL